MSEERPLIGLLADRRAASYGAWSDVDLSFVWHHYVDAVSQAGGAAVVFPPEPWLGERPALMLDALDALLLTGGRDIDAGAYGAESHPANEPGDRERDLVELALAREAIERRMPVLGVCRGMQLLNLALGGGVEQHIDDPDGVHRGEPGAFVPHPVATAEGSELARILGDGSVIVRSHHHQGITTLGTGLAVSGRSPDGVVEAIESSEANAGLCLAVLWHPEEDLEGGGAALYGALVEAARSAAIRS